VETGNEIVFSIMFIKELWHCYCAVKLFCNLHITQPVLLHFLTNHCSEVGFSVYVLWSDAPSNLEEPVKEHNCNFIVPSGIIEYKVHCSWKYVWLWEVKSVLSWWGLGVGWGFNTKMKEIYAYYVQVSRKCLIFISTFILQHLEVSKIIFSCYWYWQI
jgi:hypothetical protein